MMDVDVRIVDIVEDKMKKNILKHSVGTLVDVAIGGAVIHAVGNSNMPVGMKGVTQIGVGAAVAGKTLGRFKKWI